MNGRDEVQRLALLYGPRCDTRDVIAADLRRQLVDMGDGLAGQMAELERDFTRERAERVLQNLAGASAHVRRLLALGVD